MNKHLLKPDRKSTKKTQSYNAAKVLLGETMSLLGLLTEEQIRHGLQEHKQSSLSLKA